MTDTGTHQGVPLEQWYSNPVSRTESAQEKSKGSSLRLGQVGKLQRHKAKRASARNQCLFTLIVVHLCQLCSMLNGGQNLCDILTFLWLADVLQQKALKAADVHQRWILWAAFLHCGKPWLVNPSTFPHPIWETTAD